MVARFLVGWKGGSGAGHIAWRGWPLYSTPPLRPAIFFREPVKVNESALKAQKTTRRAAWRRRLPGRMDLRALSSSKR